MIYVEEKIKCELEDYEEGDGDIWINILFNEIHIGDITCFFDGEGIFVETIGVHEKYRGMGMGTRAIEWLIEFAKTIEANFIRGECPRARINFYKRLGAKFECRNEDDETYINNVFYIDIN